MRRHPGWGWRGLCVLIAGGLAGYAASAPLTLAELAAADAPPKVAPATAPIPVPRRPAAPVRPQPDRAVSKPSETPTPAAKPPTAAAAPVHADVLAAARQMEQLGRLPEALNTYQAVLTRYPQYVECLHRMGVVCTRMNNLEAARGHFDRALALAPDNVPLLTDAGYARFLAGNYREAEKLLHKAVLAAPGDARASNNLALVMGVTGRFDESLQLFQKVNTPTRAWTNLAYVYQLRKEPDQALICYRRAHAIDGNVQIPEELLSYAQQIGPLVTEAEGPQKPPQTAAKTQQAAPLGAARTSESPPPKLVEASEPVAPLKLAAPTPPGAPLKFLEPSQPFVTPKIAERSRTLAPLTSDAESQPEAASKSSVVVQPAETPKFADPSPSIATQPAAPPKLAEAASVSKVTIASTPAAAPQKTLPSWAVEEIAPPAPPPRSAPPARPTDPQTELAFQPPVQVRPATPRLADEDQFESPFPAETQFAARERTAENRTHAPVLETEPALTIAAPDAGQQVHFKLPDVKPTTGFVADHALSPTELAWLASERAKLVKRAHWEGTKGFCLVALMEERRLADTRDEYFAEHQGQIYNFSSPEALEQFKSNPEKYAPAAGGLDVVAVRTGSGVIAGSLDYSAWYRDRLFLFSSPEHRDEFRAHTNNYVKD